MAFDVGLYVKSGTGKGAYKASTGACIYRWYVAASIANGTGFQRIDANPAAGVFQDAYDKMVNASWSTPSGMAAHNSYNLNYDSCYRCYAGAGRWSLSSLQAGSTIKQIIVSCTPPSGSGAPDYQLKALASSSGNPPSSWSDCVSSPQYTGSTNGSVTLSCNITRDTYLYIVYSFASWTAPGGFRTIWQGGISDATVTLRYQY